MPQIGIVLGSQSDKKPLEDSKLLAVLDEIGVTYEVSVISAHRNPEALEEYCLNRDLDGMRVFVGIAGMAAALPGAVASLASSRPVIGVPLPSLEFPDAMDALFAMYRMPPGKPVAVCSLANAGLLACQIAAVNDAEVQDRLTDYLSAHTREPEIAFIKSERSE